MSGKTDCDNTVRAWQLEAGNCLSSRVLDDSPTSFFSSSSFLLSNVVPSCCRP